MFFKLGYLSLEIYVYTSIHLAMFVCAFFFCNADNMDNADGNDYTRNHRLARNAAFHALEDSGL